MRRLPFVLAAVALLGASCNLQTRVQDGGVFRSDDAGSGWTQKVFVRQEAKRTVRIDTFNARHFRFDSDGGLYLITRENGVWRTTDRGESWKQLGLTANPVDFTVDPDSSSIQYAAVGQNVQRSADAGTTWRPVYTAPRLGETVAGITVDPNDPTHLTIVTSAGSTVESRDSGATWTVLSFQKFSFSQLVAHPTTARILYATASTGAYKTLDGGATWTSLTDGLKKIPGATVVNQLALLPENPATVYAATNGGLLVSADGGTAWVPVPTLIPQGTPVSLVAVRDARTLLFVTNNRLERTDDGGANWSTPAVPTGRLLAALAFDPTQSSTAYLGVVRPAKR